MNQVQQQLSASTMLAEPSILDLVIAETQRPAPKVAPATKIEKPKRARKPEIDPAIATLQKQIADLERRLVAERQAREAAEAKMRQVAARDATDYRKYSDARRWSHGEEDGCYSKADVRVRSSDGGRRDGRFWTRVSSCR